MRSLFQFSLLLFIVLVVSVVNSSALGRQVVSRDAFPVFNNPRMLSVEVAEKLQVVLPRDAVIGVTYGGEARAYPVAVMGIHELGNDTIAGLPIVVGW